MAAPLDSFVEQLQHRIWTQFLPLCLLAGIVGVLFRLGLEKLAIAIVRLFRRKPATVTVSQDSLPLDDAPCCPDCRRPMTRRTARKGENRGAKFWGCTAYPKCRGTRPSA